jgi:hypothetical protein
MPGFFRNVLHMLLDWRLKLHTVHRSSQVHIRQYPNPVRQFGPNHSDRLPDKYFL